MIIKLLSEKVVAYSNQIKMILESEFSHSETHNKLKKLERSGKVKSLPKEFNNIGYKWYYLASTSDNKAIKAIQKTEGILKKYHVFTHDRRFFLNNIQYNDYSEYLVEQSFLAAGFRVLAMETNYFNGKTVTLGGERGPGKTLDFIIMKPSSSVFIGVQVKNRFESPNQEDFTQLKTLCEGLELKPMMVCRVCEPRFFIPMKEVGGRIIVFKRQLLQPDFDREYFDKMNDLGILIGIYREAPDFLIKLLKRYFRMFK